MRLTAARRNAFLEVLDDYREELRAGQGLPPGELPECTLEEAVAWGIARGLLQMDPEEEAEYLLTAMSAAARGDVEFTPGGKRRKRYCVRREPEAPDGDEAPHQRFFWGDVYHSSRAFLVTALEQQQDGIRQDIKTYEANAAFVSEVLIGRGHPPLHQGLLHFQP